jgi:hypothetical protein
MVSLDAPAPSLSLSQVTSHIRKRQEPGSLKHRHRRLLTQEGIFSPDYYYEDGTSGNASNCRIISAGL